MEAEESGMSGTDDGWEDLGDDVLEVAPEMQIPDIPGYLFLRDETDKAEARRAYALNYVVSNEGGFAHKWIEHWFQIDKILSEGFPPEEAPKLKAVT